MVGSEVKVGDLVGSFGSALEIGTQQPAREGSNDKNNACWIIAMK